MCVKNGGGYVAKCAGKASFVEHFKNPPRITRWIGEALALQFQNNDVAAAESETATERRDAGGRSQGEKRNGSSSVSKASASSYA